MFVNGCVANGSNDASGEAALDVEGVADIVVRCYWILR